MSFVSMSRLPAAPALWHVPLTTPSGALDVLQTVNVVWVYLMRRQKRRKYFDCICMVFDME